MLRKPAAFAIIFVAFSIISTTGNDTIPDIYRILRDAKTNLVQYPAKSLLILDSVKGLKPVKEDDHLRALICEVESQAAFYVQDFRRAYKALLAIDSLISKTQEMPRLAVNYNRMGMLLTQWGAYEKALEYLLKAYRIRQNLDEPEPLMFTLNALATLYSEMNEVTMAKATIRQALKQSERSDDVFQISYILHNAGQIEEKYGNMDSAMFFYRRALNNRIELQNNYGQIQSYQSIANLLQKQRQLDSAYFYVAKANEFARNVNSRHDIFQSQIILSEILKKQGQWVNAELLLRKILPEIENYPHPNLRKKVYNLLSGIYEDKGDYSKALHFARKSMDLSDSLMVLNREEKISQLTLVYRMEEKEREEKKIREQAYLQQEQYNNNIKWFIFLAVLIIGTLGFLVFIFYSKSKRNKMQVDNAQHASQSLLRKMGAAEQQNRELAAKNQELMALESKTRKTLQAREDEIGHLQKSMLAPVKSIVQITSSMLADQPFDPRQRSFIEKIHCTGKSLERNILKIQNSEREGTSANVIFEVCNIETIVTDVTQYAREKMSENRSIELVFSFSELSDDRQLVSNHQAIVQILESLIDNAFENSNPGILKIGVRVVDFQIRFYVDDSRMSVPIEVQTALQQWQNPMVGAIPETGLLKYGNHIFKACQLSGKLGTTLSFETSNSWGNMFYFVLSLRLTENVKIVNDQVFPIWPDKHILIAEDEYLNFEVLRNYLKPTKVKISHARNGQEILEMIKLFKFDLIIMDIKMPQLDGIDTMQELKKQPFRVPVVAQTAHALASEKANFLQMGFADFLLKPINRMELYQVIDRLFMVTG